jgi:type II secretory pathway component PulF
MSSKRATVCAAVVVVVVVVVVVGVVGIVMPKQQKIFCQSSWSKRPSSDVV